MFSSTKNIFTLKMISIHNFYIYLSQPIHLLCFSLVMEIGGNWSWICNNMKYFLKKFLAGNLCWRELFNWTITTVASSAFNLQNLRLEYGICKDEEFWLKFQFVVKCLSLFLKHILSWSYEFFSDWNI